MPFPGDYFIALQPTNIQCTDGDSGGPLYVKKGRKLYQYAITSFSTSGCAEVGGTPWYVRASAYTANLKRIMDTGKDSKFKKYT